MVLIFKVSGHGWQLKKKKKRMKNKQRKGKLSSSVVPVRTSTRKK